MASKYEHLYRTATIRGNSAIVSRSLMRTAAFVHGRNEEFTCNEAMTEAFEHEGYGAELLLVTQPAFRVIEQVCMAPSDEAAMNNRVVKEIADYLHIRMFSYTVEASMGGFEHKDRFSLVEGVRMLLEGLSHLDKPQFFCEALDESLDTWTKGFSRGKLAGKFDHMEDLLKRDYANMPASARGNCNELGAPISVETFGPLW